MFRTTLTRRTSTKLTTTRQTRLIAATGSTTRNIAEALLITGRQRARSKINCSSAVAELAIVLATELALEIAPVVELLLVIAPVVAELERVPVAVELERALVAVELERALVAVELERDQAAAGLAQGHPRVQPAVAPTTKSVTAAHRRDLVRLLAAEDLAAAAAETTREPAAAEGVIAWEVAE